MSAKHAASCIHIVLKLQNPMAQWLPSFSVQAEKRFATALELITGSAHGGHRSECDVGGIYLGLGASQLLAGAANSGAGALARAMLGSERWAVWRAVHGHCMVRGPLCTTSKTLLSHVMVRSLTGLVKDRLGNTKEAVPVLESAVAHYKKVHNGDESSLIAKALSSTGKCKEKIKLIDEAGADFAEAVVRRSAADPILPSFTCVRLHRTCAATTPCVTTHLVAASCVL
jgi:hypothetical protein